MTLKLYGRPGSGSGVCEAILALARADAEIIDMGHWPDGEPPADLVAINALGQIPVLVFPDGAVMTESAAISIYLADLFPKAGLAPTSDADRAAYLRWMVYMAANLYMTELRMFYPHRYGEAESVRASAAERRLVEWKVLADALGDRDFLIGERMTAADLYAAMLMSWAEDLEDFVHRFPNLGRLYRRVADVPAVNQVWSRHGMPV